MTTLFDVGFQIGLGFWASIIGPAFAAFLTIDAFRWCVKKLRGGGRDGR
jgi:hypothetical protein